MRDERTGVLASTAPPLDGHTRIDIAVLDRIAACPDVEFGACHACRVGLDKSARQIIRSLPVVTSTGTEDAIELLTTGGTSHRYDTTAGQFIQNWKTPTGAGITVLFKIK